jgi:cyclase
MKEVLGMSNIRIIAKLDVKPPYLVKPVHFEGLRKLGEPVDFVKKYQDADEIFYIDIVASLYEREVLFDEIRKCADETLVPFAVGGGVRSLEDFSKLFHNGADKVVINTHAIKNPSIIDEASKVFGNQAVVVNIEAKKQNDWWECYTDCGRNRSNKDVVDWAREVEQRGAGEILLQSVDCDGRKRGFDLELAKKVIDSVNIPVVVASGAGSLDDIKKLASINPSGIAIASLIHYDELSISDIKKGLR